MNDKVQNVIGKIQKLRALSESTTSKSEKETCLFLCAKLIAEHALSEAEIAVTTGANEPIDLESESIIYESGRLSAWKSRLALSLDSLNRTELS